MVFIDLQRTYLWVNKKNNLANYWRSWHLIRILIIGILSGIDQHAMIFRFYEFNLASNHGGILAVSLLGIKAIERNIVSSELLMLGSQFFEPESSESLIPFNPYGVGFKNRQFLVYALGSLIAR
jgi:hypothetical protein